MKKLKSKIKRNVSEKKMRDMRQALPDEFNEYDFLQVAKYYGLTNTKHAGKYLRKMLQFNWVSKNRIGNYKIHKRYL
jgi:hypothetical protein